MRPSLKITIEAELKGKTVERFLFSWQPDFTEAGHHRLEKAIKIYVNHLKQKHPKASFIVNIPSRLNTLKEFNTLKEAV
jgi:hypothetical protein